MLGIWQKKCRLGWVILVWSIISIMMPMSEAGVLILDNTSSLTMADGGTQTLDMSNTSKYFGYTFRVKAGAQLQREKAILEDCKPSVFALRRMEVLHLGTTP